jgi:hypothetical protein
LYLPVHAERSPWELDFSLSQYSFSISNQIVALCLILAILGKDHSFYLPQEPRERVYCWRLSR